MTESDRSAGWAAYYQQLRDRPPRKTVLAALDAFGDAPADALVIDLGCVLLPLDPRQAVGGREVHAPGELHVGQRAVGLQLGEDAEVDGVELHDVL